MKAIMLNSDIETADLFMSLGLKGMNLVMVEHIPERTCKMYRDEIGIWHCESCKNGGDKIMGSDGELDEWYASWHPVFCPYCGCKVID